MGRLYIQTIILLRFFFRPGTAFWPPRAAQDSARDPKNHQNDPQSEPNWSPKWSQKRSCLKNHETLIFNNSPTFLLDFYYPRACLGPQKTVKKSKKKRTLTKTQQKSRKEAPSIPTNRTRDPKKTNKQKKPSIKGGVGGTRAWLWGLSKTPLSQKSSKKHIGKPHFGKTA